MIQNAVPPNATLALMLHTRALATPAHRLVLDVLLGGAAAALALWFRPVIWVQLGSAGLCFATYGIWAFAERHIENSTDEVSRTEELLWGGVRGVAAGLGMISAVALATSVAGAMLGTWIS